MQPLLLADATLGKLARWLRWLGYDTTYVDGDGDEVVARARAEGRVLLTRNRSFLKRSGVRVVLMESLDLEGQLSQVVADLGELDLESPSRCMVCNVPLVSRSVEDVRALVPPYVAETQREFHQCPQCKKVYWPGTHWVAMRERLISVHK